VPREPVDAGNDLPKEPLRQVAFGKLQDEVPGMSDEAQVPPRPHGLVVLVHSSFGWLLA